MFWLISLPFKFMRVLGLLMIIKPYTFFYRALSPNVGLRIVRGWLLVGLPLTIITFVVLSLMFRSYGFFNAPLKLIYAIAFLFFVVKPLRRIVRKRFSATWLTVSILRWLTILAIGFYTWIVLPQMGLKYAFQLYVVENIQLPVFIYEAYNQTLGAVFEYLNIQLFSTKIADLDKFLLFTLGAFLLGFFLCYGIPMISYCVEIIKENGFYRRWYVQGHASRWAGPGTYKKYPWRLEFGRRTKRIYLGRTRFEDYAYERDVFAFDDAHMLTVGASGSGKSLCSIWPLLATYKGSTLVMDPKGEHSKAFITRRIRLNKKVCVLDPFGTATSLSVKEHKARYNPLSEVDLSEPWGRKRLSAITSSMIIKTDGNNRFWEEGALTFLEGIIAYVLLTFPEEFHNLPAITKIILGRDSHNRADIGNLHKLTLDMLACDNELVQTAATFLSSLEGREYGIVLTEVMNAIKWTTDPAIADHISHSDFKFSDFQKHTMSVFVCAPFGAMVEHDRWLRILTNLSMRIMEDNQKKIKPSVVFVLDEVAQYGRELKQLKHDIVTLRSAGVKLWPFVQNFTQLEDCFGKAAVADFESSSTIQVFGVRDNETAVWVSNKLGQTTQKRSIFKSGKNDQEHTVPLMDVAKVQTTLQKTKPLQIVFPADGFPMLLERLSYKPVKVEGQRFRGLKLKGLYHESQK